MELTGALQPSSRLRDRAAALQDQSAIDDERVREPPMAPDALAQHHHAGPVASRIECHVEGETPAGECVDQDSHPRPPEWAASVGADNFNVQFRVINVTNLKRAITVTWSSRLQFKIER